MKRESWLAVCVLIAACGGGGKKETGGPAGGGAVAGGPGAGSAAVDPGAAEVVATATPGTGLIDRRVFFGNPERTAAQLSPDGKYLAWLAPKDGVLNVWITPANDLTKAEPVTADTSRPVRQYFWAFDNKHLLYMQDKGGDENFHVFKVSVADKQTTDLTPTAGVLAQVYGLSHKKPNQILVGMNDRDPQLHDVWKIDLATGAKTLVFENKDGFVGFDADLDLNLQLAQKMSADGGTLYFKRDAKGGWTEYDRIAPEDQLTTSTLGFDKKGRSLYLISSRGRDTGALYAVDFATKKRKLLYANAKADVDAAMIHPTERTVQAVSYEYDRQRWEVLDKRIQRDLAGIAKLDRGDFNVVSRTLNDKVWLVAMFGDTQATKYYRWDRARQQGTFLFTTRPELEGQPLAPMHPVEIKTRDGLTMVSYLTLPNAADLDHDGKPDRPVPTVMFVHGGPWARDSWGNNPIHQLLANRGYAVLSPNYRGSTGFGKAFVNAGNGEWGGKMHDDLIDAAAWLVEQGIAPKDRIGIMGGSYGGYATLAGLTLTPDVFACGVDLVGVSNIMTFIESIPPYWAPFLAQLKDRVGDWTTPEGKQRLLDRSPITHVEKIIRPLLIGQGANDPRVKQAESDTIARAMQDRHIPVTYALFPDEGHGFARPENNLAFFAVTEAFLSAHLGGVYQPLTAEELTASSIQIKAGKAGIPGWPLE